MKKLLGGIVSYLKQTDLWIWFLGLGLSGFSVVLLAGIYESGVYVDVSDPLRPILVQIGATGAGALAALVLSKIDYHTMTKFWKLHAPLAYFLVGLTFVIGVGTDERLSDRLWFRLPGGMTFQPSEVLKISFILTLAWHLHVLGENLNRPLNLLGVCAHGAVPVALIHIQKDDGTALVFLIIFIGMVFAAGVSWRYIIPALLMGIAALPLGWMYLLDDYQKRRFLALYSPNPDAGFSADLYQQNNARLAIGSGQIWGKGIFSENHKYVPKAQNDFIFAFIGDALGFIGCLATVAVILALCLKMLGVAHRALDLQGKLVCVGVFVMIISQAIINIGMCISVLPVIGITLPFLSQGGSSILAAYMGLGLVLSVHMHSEKPMFGDD